MFDLIGLGAAIKRLRINAGLSQQELASMAGVHRTYLSDMENGRRNVTLEILHRVASGLNVKLSKLTSLAEILSNRDSQVQVETTPAAAAEEAH
jgi:transcriptional regulator with XRE-family HTH domain